MKGKELMIIALIIVVLLIVIVVGSVAKKGNEKEPVQTPSIGVTDENSNEEYVELKPDGTKVNISSELGKIKEVDGLEISNIRLTENGNVSQLLADVKNPTANTLGDFAIDITVLDKNGSELAVIGGYVDKVEAGESVKLNTSVTVDIANAYDFKVSKK